MRRICGWPGCTEFAVTGRSRCFGHGGSAWARQPPERQAHYGSGTYQLNRKIAIRGEPRCHWGLEGCTGRSTEADHLVSLAAGGDDSLDNLVGACASCNRKRGADEGRATRAAVHASMVRNRTRKGK
jgi:5-methylcytosine-specific restriction endonuclease McrA